MSPCRHQFVSGTETCGTAGVTLGDLDRDLDVRSGVRLGVDVGTVRIGVARCDPGGMLASPLDTVRRGAGDLAELARLAAENDAIEIVVGLAVGLRGSEGKAAADGRDFAADLARRLAPLPVRLVDERFTTVLAHAALQARRPGFASQAPGSGQGRGSVAAAGCT